MIRHYIFHIIIFFVFCFKINAQDCPSLIDPLEGATNVPIDTAISWNPVDGVTGYIISIGTTLGGTDIVDSELIGGNTTFTPQLGLPDNSEIFVTLTLFFFNLPDIECESQSFFTEDFTSIPSCTSLSNPNNGQTNVSIATNINWNYATGATGYIITIGTSPGLGDIVNNLDVGNTLSYNPITDFPASTLIYVEIVPYNENGTATACTEYSFTTGVLAALPSCTNLIYPTDGTLSVPLSPIIEWESVAGAIGYKVYLGTTLFNNDILNGAIFYTNSTLVINFEANSVYFIRIVPFNDAGDAIGCGQSTFSTLLGCGPFYDEVTGELVSLNPDITFPDQVGICLNETPTIINSPNIVDGVRWYLVEDDGNEVLISSEDNVQINTTGNYLYEAYNLSNDSGHEIECSSFKYFEVVSSEIPTIDAVNVVDDVNGIEISVFVSGIGDYEYSLDNIDGPYQDENIFNNAPENTSIIYVRDKNGCGVTSYNIDGSGVSNGFPKIFTPNGDTFNDYWRYIPKTDDTFLIIVIDIFDRFGKHIISINPLSLGWDGRFNGNPLQETDYWYYATTNTGQIFKGHFALKR